MDWSRKTNLLVLLVVSVLCGPRFPGASSSTIKLTCPRFFYCTAATDCPPGRMLRSYQDNRIGSIGDCFYSDGGEVRLGVCCTDVADDIYDDFEDVEFERVLARFDRVKRSEYTDGASAPSESYSEQQGSSYGYEGDEEGYLEKFYTAEPGGYGGSSSKSPPMVPLSQPVIPEHQPGIAYSRKSAEKYSQKGLKKYVPMSSYSASIPKPKSDPPIPSQVKGTRKYQPRKYVSVGTQRKVQQKYGAHKAAPVARQHQYNKTYNNPRDLKASTMKSSSRGKAHAYSASGRGHDSTYKGQYSKAQTKTSRYPTNPKERGSSVIVYSSSGKHEKSNKAEGSHPGSSTKKYKSSTSSKTSPVRLYKAHQTLGPVKTRGQQSSYNKRPHDYTRSPHAPQSKGNTKHSAHPQNYGRHSTQTKYVHPEIRNSGEHSYRGDVHSQHSKGSYGQTYTRGSSVTHTSRKSTTSTNQHETKTHQSKYSHYG